MEEIIIVLVLIIILALIIIYRLNQERIQTKYLLSLTEKIENISDIKNLSYTLANEIMELFCADLVSIMEYSPTKTKILAQTPNKINIQEIISKTNTQEIFLIIENLQQQKNNFIDKYDLKSEHFKNIFPLYQQENFIIIPIFKNNEKTITLEIYGESKYTIALKKNFLLSIIEIFKKLYKQQSIFEYSEQKIKKDEIIINFLDRIKNSFEEKELEKLILKEIGEAFKADRTYLLFVPKDFSHIPIYMNEYLSNIYIKSLLGNDNDTQAVWEELRENNISPPIFIIENSEKFITQNNLEGSKLESFLKKSEIKSSYPFLILEEENSYTYLVIQYTKNPIHFSKTDFKIMELLSRQTTAVLKQAKLKTKILENSKKEKLLIELISILRSNLDLKKVVNEFTSKVGEFFEAQRCIIRFYDKEENIFLGFENAYEYKKHFYTPSTKNENIDGGMVEFLLQTEKFHDTLAMQYAPEFFDEDFEYKEIVLDYFKKHKIKSYLAAFIKYNGELRGVISLHFNKIKSFNKPDEIFIKALADQLGTAIYQSELYLNVQKQASQEKLLKEVLSDTINMRSKEEIFGYFAKKINNILDANGTVFIELSENNINEIKYFEYYKTPNSNLCKFKKIRNITDKIKNQVFNYSCDLEKLKTDEETADFLEETGIICIGTIPIYKNTIAIIFFNNEKNLNEFDKNLLFSLVELISKSIKEILNNAEINNLREAFLATITHDLQIPLIAQRNAIKYLIEKFSNCEQEKQYELLKNLLETNEEIEDILKTLMEIYKYETKKKIIEQENCDFIEILENAITKCTHEIEDKNIFIQKEFYNTKNNFWGDKKEISKAILIILKNIINFSSVNSKIEIITSEDNNKLKCCISSEYPTLSNNIRELLFEKSLASKTLEYKIGEGIHLYLAKLILQENNSKIYLENNDTLTLCLELE